MDLTHRVHHDRTCPSVRLPFTSLRVTTSSDVSLTERTSVVLGRRLPQRPVKHQTEAKHANLFINDQTH